MSVKSQVFTLDTIIQKKKPFHFVKPISTFPTSLLQTLPKFTVNSQIQCTLPFYSNHGKKRKHQYRVVLLNTLAKDFPFHKIVV